MLMVFKSGIEVASTNPGFVGFYSTSSFSSFAVYYGPLRQLGRCEIVMALSGIDCEDVVREELSMRLPGEQLDLGLATLRGM